MYWVIDVFRANTAWSLPALSSELAASRAVESKVLYVYEGLHWVLAEQQDIKNEKAAP